MTAPKTSRPGGRTARVRKAVLDAALDVLAEAGLTGFSIGAVAQHAGVNETSIYRRWGTRENLITDALLSLGDEEIPIPDTGTLRQDLLVFTVGLHAFLNSARGRALAAAAVIPVQDDELEQTREAFWRSRSELVGEVVRRAIRRKEIADEVEPRLVIEAIVAPMHIRILLTRHPLDDDLPRQLVDLVIDGLPTPAS